MTHAPSVRKRRWRAFTGAATACVLAAALTTAVGTSPAVAADEDLAQYVDPFIGTDEADVTNAPLGGKLGGAFPGATVPFGRVQWSPDTQRSEASYKSDATTLWNGFSINHTSGAGCQSMQDVPFGPTVGQGVTDVSALPFTRSPGNEVATPGFYKLKLDNQAQAELTATQRTGMGRFTFPQTQYANIVVGRPEYGNKQIDVSSDKKKISGWVESGFFCGSDHLYRFYFSVEFDRAFTSFTNTNGRVVTTFDATTDRDVQARVGTSLVSVANAEENVRVENNAWNFEAVKDAARAAWNTQLNKIKITTTSADQREIFYTALYNSLLHPNVATDSNGQYLGVDKRVYTATGWTKYYNFSGWDVYRTQVQLLAMIAPTVASDWARSLLDHASQCGGMLPVWTQYHNESGVMVGIPAIPAISSMSAFGANATGLTSQDVLDKFVFAAETADKKCYPNVANARVLSQGLSQYKSRGYVAYDDPVTNFGKEGSAAWTQEYAIADFALAQYAKAQRNDTTVFDKYLKRSENWRKVFDTASKYIQPRNSSGAFTSNTNNQYILEGNSSQYTWMNPHDYDTVINLVGGKAAAVARLDSLFTKLNAGEKDPYYYIGNQPNFWTPWAYLWAGEPAKTQDVVHRIRTQGGFNSTPNGYPGNLDLGATSSWYVFAALGLFPVTPGTDVLALNGPSFTKATIALANNKTLTIDAPNAGGSNRYIQSLTVNGVASNKAWTRFSSIKDGATLNFTVGSTPTTWGSAEADGPPRFVTAPETYTGTNPNPDPGTGGTDYARNTTPTSNRSDCAGGEGPANVVDGNASTKWCAFGVGSDNYLTFDLGQNRTITRWSVAHAGSNNEPAADNTKAFTLQSADSLTGTWTNRDPVTNNTANTTDRTLSGTNAATARYWRIQFVSPTQDTDPAIRIYNVSLFGAGSTTTGDLALNKAASANNTCATTETADKGVDGRADTKWCGYLGSGEAWLQVDLGSAQSVRRWVVKHAQSGNEPARYNTKDYELQYSSTGTGSWTRLDFVTGNTAASTDRTATNAASARYWRLRVTAPTQDTDSAARIYALELYS